MRFVTTKRTLAEALGKVQGIPLSKGYNPVTQYLLLSAQDGETVTITASSEECSAKVTFHADITEKGVCTMHGPAILNIVKVLPDAPIICETLANGHVKVSAASTTYTIFGIDPNEFPVLEPPNADVVLRLSPELVHEICDHVLFACADSSCYRTELCGVFMKVTPSDEVTIFEAVATDGYRLARLRRSTGVQSLCNSPFTALIHGKTMSNIKNFIGDSGDFVDVYQRGNVLWFAQGPDYLRSNQLDAKYPDYEKVFGMPQTNRVVLDKAALQMATKRAAALLYERRQYFVFLRFEPQKGIVVAKCPDGAGATDAIDVEHVEGGIFAVHLNCDYLLAALAALSSAKVLITGQDEFTPVFLQGVDDDTVLQVIMPVRA